MKQKAFYRKYVSNMGYGLCPYLIPHGVGETRWTRRASYVLTRDISYSSTDVAIQLLCLLVFVSLLALVLLAATDGADLRSILE